MKIMTSSPITTWKIDKETVEDSILGGSIITADGDCSHEIKRRLLLGRKVMTNLSSVQFSSVAESSPTLCDPTKCSTPGLSVITNSRHPPKPMSIESVMPSNHLILCHPLLLQPSILPSIKVFSNESAVRIRWPEYWSFSFSISPSNEHPGHLGLTGWISLQSKGLSRVFSNTTVQKHQLFGAQLSL